MICLLYTSVSFYGKIFGEIGIAVFGVTVTIFMVACADDIRHLVVQTAE